jgi:CRISPR type III-B/RAMP module-associated protein Cmr3
VPFRLKQDAFDQYRKGKLKGFFGVDDIGCARPVTQDIQHNAINTDSGKSDDGRLYRTRNLYLSGKGNDSLGIQAVIANIPQGATIPERAYLGGERRTVDLNAVESSMLPAFPKDYAGEKFLKLVLLTPGDFGGWIPEWLRPSLDGSWVSTPSGHAKVRLRHAWLNGWTPVSGWDYLNRRAKPMRKLVPEGAVYLIELEEPSRADAIAEEFWGKPFQQGISAKDGFGYVICTKTGNLIHTEN